MQIKLAIIGFGNVGQGLAQILEDKNSFYNQTFNTDFSIVAISDLYKGSIYNPLGLANQTLLDTVKQGNSLETIDAPNNSYQPAG